MTLHSLYEIASRQLAGSKVKTFVGFVIGMHTVNLYDDFEKMGKKKPHTKTPTKKELGSSFGCTNINHNHQDKLKIFKIFQVRLIPEALMAVTVDSRFTLVSDN